jgi:hypothetical protein
MKKAKLSNAPKLSFVGTTYLCHDHGIGSQTRHITFEKHDKMLGNERGFHNGTIFKVPRSFNFFIKGGIKRSEYKFHEENKSGSLKNPEES